MAITHYSISKDLRALTEELISFSGKFNMLIGRVDTLRILVEEQFKEEIDAGGYEEFKRKMEWEAKEPSYIRLDTNDERDETIAKIKELQRQLTTNKPPKEVEC